MSEQSITDVYEKFVTTILQPLIGLLFAAAVLVFVYGLVEFLAKPDNSDAQSAGKRHMLWGVIGLTIMVSAWGIVEFLKNTLGVDF